MKIRRALEFVVIIPLLVLAADVALGDWPSNLSNAVWWQRFPWALLALSWAGLLYWLWRERRQPRA